MRWISTLVLSLWACTPTLPGDPPSRVVLADRYLATDLDDFNARLDPRSAALYEGRLRLLGVREAGRISDRGDVAGSILLERVDAPGKYVAHAALWRRAGWDDGAGRWRYELIDLGIRWSQDVLKRDPGTEDFSQAYAVNERGQVVGDALVAERVLRPFFYDPEGDTILDLTQVCPACASFPALRVEAGLRRLDGWGLCPGRAGAGIARDLSEGVEDGGALTLDIVGAAQVHERGGACGSLTYMTGRGQPALPLYGATRWTLRRKPLAGGSMVAPRYAYELVGGSPALLAGVERGAQGDRLFDAEAGAINAAGQVLVYAFDPGSSSSQTLALDREGGAALALDSIGDILALSDSPASRVPIRPPAAPDPPSCASAFEGGAVALAGDVWEMDARRSRSRGLPLRAAAGDPVALDVTRDAVAIVGYAGEAAPMRWRWACPPEVPVAAYVEAPLPPGTAQVEQLTAINGCGEMIGLTDSTALLLTPLLGGAPPPGCP